MSNSFNFQIFSVFLNENIEYLKVLVVQRRLCQLQINSTVKTFVKWEMSIQHVPTVSCTKCKAKILFLML